MNKSPASLLAHARWDKLTDDERKAQTEKMRKARRKSAKAKRENK